MGGAYGEGNVTPAAEFNIWVDPEAAARVFQSGLDVTMIGLDVSHQAIFGPEPTAQIKAAGRVGAMVAELLEFYGRFHKQSYGWEGSPIHDAVAMAHVFKPGIVETVHVGVRVDCGEELGRGRTNCDLRGRVGWEPNAEVGVGSTRTGSSACWSSASPRWVEAGRHHAPGRALAGARRALAPARRARRRDDLGGRPPRRELAASEQPWFEAWSCLTALAHVTGRARIGPLVSPMTYRNPAVLARTALTVAELSGGRLELGIGSGASAFDHELTQVPQWEAEGARGRLHGLGRSAARGSGARQPPPEARDPAHDRRARQDDPRPLGPIRGSLEHVRRVWDDTRRGAAAGPGDNELLDELCAETGRTVLRSSCSVTRSSRRSSGSPTTCGPTPSAPGPRPALRR